MSPQAERDGANQQAREASDYASQRNSDPWRDIGMNEQQRRRKCAQSEERGMAERDQARIPRKQIPGQTHDGPDRDQCKHELVVRIPGEHHDRDVSESEHDNSEAGRARLADKHVRYARSTLRPNRPWGRINNMIRKTTKTVVP